jgi:hypothetical protein
MKMLKTSRTFKKEFRRQLRLAITAAIGFTIAFAWRNALFAFFENLTSRLLDVPKEHYLSEVYTSTVITLTGVILILITAKVLKERA